MLAAHEAALEARIRQCGDSIARVRRLRAELGGGKMPATRDIIGAVRTRPTISVAFDLPWPWGGERFELRDVKPLNYIVGPLGSGKTRLAQRLAETLPDAAFVGLDRAADGGAAVRVRASMPIHPTRRGSTRAAPRSLAAGAVDSPALTALLAALEADGDTILVIDMLEHGLDAASQEAVIAHLRRRGPDGAAAVLPHALQCDPRSRRGRRRRGDHPLPGQSQPADLASTPVPGAVGYEAVATCLASPEVRARTEGMIAWRPA